MIDSHVHFFDATRPNGVVWPPEDSNLPKSALPADLEKAAGDIYIDGVIAVETSRRFEDDEWLLSLAEHESLIKGVVLNLQPDQADFDARYEIAQRSRFFCGIRLRPISDYDLSSSVLRKNIAKLAEGGYSIEFGARSVKDKECFAELARDFPETHWVLNHCGHPGLGIETPDTSWLESMQRISENPNAVAKLTNPFGLASSPAPVGVADSYRALMAELHLMFGHERLIFGSNWPVCSLTATYKEVVSIHLGCLPNEDHGAAVFSSNAARVYRCSRAKTVPSEVD